MKNAAKCDTWCELQNPVNHRVFERNKFEGESPTITVDEPTLETNRACQGGYPLSLSISISEGKETNKDSPSNGERIGKSQP
ncbi:hypothetical protein PHAVU_003G090301 [Phaseolus vulgaris]|uniref:Uncharacterized protein n=1 Tax=Phaseolus vulgaris TaxID=3885 RepID=V7C9Y4_PHAVU|nr:hypothetical protein PHAVU_003G090200g [Phaseolus vulgaris]ESW26090.1 hypothetical protein PHAVU_003G090200g [Phaseolus vulgaris]